jgi:hypothetical protein
MLSIGSRFHFPKQLKIVGEKPATSCNHIDHRLVLDANADVYLCCASSGAPTNIVGNFLASTLSEIQAAKSTHSLCGPCMKHSVMTYFDRANVEDVEFSALGDAKRAEYEMRRNGGCGMSIRPH